MRIELKLMTGTRITNGQAIACNVAGNVMLGRMPMDNPSLLAIAMAAHCREALLEWHKLQLGLPLSLQPGHLIWMCDRIEEHAEDWAPTKLHRWIGFVQAGMLANQILDLSGAKAMFDDAKNAYGELTDDFLDHLDPANSFELDIGGEG